MTTAAHPLAERMIRHTLRQAAGGKQASPFSDQFNDAGALQGVDPALAKEISQAGLKDGDPNDDKVPTKQKVMKSVSLKPSQTTMVVSDIVGVALEMLYLRDNDSDLGALVSSDNYILDGHHRWAASILAWGTQAKVKVWQAGVKGETLIKILNILSKGAYGVSTGNSGKGSIQNIVPGKIRAQLEEFLLKGRAHKKFAPSGDLVKKILKDNFGSVEKGIDMLSRRSKLIETSVPSWAPNRSNMPVIKRKNAPGAAKLLNQGVIDWHAPYSDSTSRMAAAVNNLTGRWMKEAAGTEKDITSNLPNLEDAFLNINQIIAAAVATRMLGDNSHLRRTAHPHWLRILTYGRLVLDGIISTRSIPRKYAKGIEMAYRLCSNSRRMPKDVLKWWKTNKKRFELTLMAAKTWPGVQDGTDDMFKVGSFNVHNVIGASGTELAAFKKVIAAAEKMVRKNSVPGFTKVLYGEIYYVGNISRSRAAAWYNINEDVLYTRPTKKWGMDEVEVLLHELGHRYWRKFVSKDKKHEWFLHHLSVSGRNVDFEVAMPEVGDALRLRIPRMPRGWRPVVSRIEDGEYWFTLPNGSERSHSVFSMRKFLYAQARNEAKQSKYPTAYSATNQEEHFCEAVSLMSVGKLPPVHSGPFAEIWG